MDVSEMNELVDHLEPTFPVKVFTPSNNEIDVPENYRSYPFGESDIINSIDHTTIKIVTPFSRKEIVSLRQVSHRIASSQRVADRFSKLDKEESAQILVRTDIEDVVTRVRLPGIRNSSQNKTVTQDHADYDDGSLSFLEYSFHFALLIWEILVSIGMSIFKIVKKVAKLFVTFGYLLSCFLMTIFLIIWFFMTFWLPKTKKQKSIKTPNLDTTEIESYHQKHGRFLFLDLDNTLVFSSTDKPNKGLYKTVKTMNASGSNYDKFYVFKRPHLDEFLQEVS